MVALVNIDGSCAEIIEKEKVGQLEENFAPNKSPQEIEELIDSFMQNS
jgi:hypothetical protein